MSLGDANASLDSDLTSPFPEEAHRYSLVQLLRLLEGAPGKNSAVTVAPQQSLAFPASDVARVERVSPHEVRISVGFLGLYGTSSPLPSFYTEELQDETASDGSVRRDFLDIVHRRLYQLYFDCWCKYRVWHSVARGDDLVLERLFSLIGMAEPELRTGMSGVEPRALLRYAGLLGGATLSAAGLATLLGDALAAPVSVLQCVTRTVTIAPDQRLSLGKSSCSLGCDAVLGANFVDAAGKFRLQIGPVRKETFERLLPGGEMHGTLSALVACYLSHPLEYDVKLILIERDVTTVRLGSTRLGFDSWCFSGSFEGDAEAVLKPA